MGCGRLTRYGQRLEIRLTQEEYERLKECADTRGVSMGQLVREAIDREYGAGRDEREHEKQRALDALFAIEAPVDDWPQMKAEIERGRIGR